MSIIQFMFYALAVALFAAFVLTLLGKWGAIEYVQVRGNKFFAEMFSCQFCLSWWTGVLLAILLAAAVDPILFLIPFFSTMITRALL